MLRLLPLAAVFAAAHAAKTCVSNEGWGSCSETVPNSEDGEDPFVLTEICFTSFNLKNADGADAIQDSGCLPDRYYKDLVANNDLTKPGCTPIGACWCLTDDCNTNEWATQQWADYVPPPVCYGGIAGANEGPKCSENKVYDDNKVEIDCHSRTLSNQCIENNEGMGRGDGCSWNDETSESRTENDCESYRAGERDVDDSFDGTTKHCRWLPAKEKDALTAACETDEDCKFYGDRGERIDDVPQGSCERSEIGNGKDEAWQTMRGSDCQNRVAHGCFENNEWMGENDACTSKGEEQACISQASGDCEHTSNGVCSGDAGCSKRNNEWECAPEDHGGMPDSPCKDNYNGRQYDHPDCQNPPSNQCVENNAWMGRGDGCSWNDETSESRTENDCESYRAGERNADDSFDGTTKHCRWAPAVAMDAKKAACETNDQCTFYEDRGEWIEDVPQGSCDPSEEEQAKSSAWDEKRGKSCGDRIKPVGCYENNEWMGQGDGCPWDDNGEKRTEDNCASHRAGERTLDDSFDGTTNHCQWVEAPADPTTECATNGAGTLADVCVYEEPEPPLTCSWEKQCCQWIPEPTDRADTCATKGAGTLATCDYTDGDGAPSADIVSAGYDHGLFQVSAGFNGKCAMVATFRDGKGSAVALGANEADLIGSNCERTEDWNSLAEHIGHDSDSINEYCTNFVPDRSAMAAFEKYSPGEIIAAAKSGQFATLFPGLKDNLFIVTTKPEYGECLFTAAAGTFGAAVCVCDTPQCNNKEALLFVVDPKVGPMRLLQFLDGSLANIKDEVNAVVPGLLQSDGKIDAANVDGVTEADIDAIMKLAGMTKRTNKAELWGIVQDFQKLAGFIAAGGDPDDARAADGELCYPESGGGFSQLLCDGGLACIESTVDAMTAFRCTAAPTTVAPTTVAPPTAAPTTVAPTTVAPTTSDEDSGSGADDLNKKLNDLLNDAIDDSSATSLAVGIATIVAFIVATVV